MRDFIVMASYLLVLIDTSAIAMPIHTGYMTVCAKYIYTYTTEVLQVVFNLYSVQMSDVYYCWGHVCRLGRCMHSL